MKKTATKPVLRLKYSHGMICLTTVTLLSRQSSATNTTKKAKSRQRDFSKIDSRKVPEHKLKNVLELLESNESSVWNIQNNLCAPCIHYEVTHAKAEVKKIAYARTCLLRRDWKNLARVLTLSNPQGPRYNSFVFPLCVKYATICLSHNNEQLLKSYISSMDTAECNEIISKCTKY